MQKSKQLDVLAVAAHPDDVELSAGGTLIKLAAMGYRIGIVDLTRGEAGTRGTPEQRAKEAARAAKVLGVTIRETLDLGDAHIWPDENSRIQVVRVLRRLRPRVILTQHWDDPHPDHAHTSQLVREAAHLAGIDKYDAETNLERFRPSCVAYFLFSHKVVPSFMVDISAASRQKWQAIRCHASQFYNPRSRQPESRVSTRRFLEEIESRDRYLGALIGVDRAEGFYVREALNVADPVALLTQTMNLYS